MAKRSRSSIQMSLFGQLYNRRRAMKAAFRNAAIRKKKNNGLRTSRSQFVRQLANRMQ